LGDFFASFSKPEIGTAMCLGSGSKHHFRESLHCIFVESHFDTILNFWKGFMPRYINIGHYQKIVCSTFLCRLNYTAKSAIS